MTELQNKTYTIKIGTDDFKKLITESTLYVDKTILLKTIIEDAYDVLLVTRPRRWGKTLNMTMLQYFFGIPVKSNGEIDEEEQSKRQDIFSQLKIGDHPDILENYLGKFPVIFVSFKEIKGKDYETIEVGVRDLIYELFTRHKYLLQSEKLDDIQKKRFNKFITKDFDIAELKSSFFYLSEMLYTHFSQKVFILIDEYDTPLNDWYALQLARDTFSVQEETYFQDVLELFKGIFGKALKGNDYLEKGVVTGILRVAKASLFSGLNNFGEDSILDEDYAEHFGFTEEEVNTLLHKSNIDKNPETALALKSWYNGYNIGGLTIYNPWSIMNCIQNRGKFKAYWVGTASTALIEQALILDKFQEEIQTLIEGESVDMIADPKMVFADIKSSPNALYNLLLFSGYLTVERSIENDDTTYNCEVKIPNREVRSVFSGSLQKWIAQKFNIDVNDYNAFLNDLLKGNVDAFTQKLKDYLETSASFFATGPKNSELFYNGFIMGLVSSVSSQYFVDAERESGVGRADLLLIPKPLARYQNALVLEFKFGKLETDLHLLAQKALEQIELKN
ncbi:MAG TPA: AAA family ATPase, partial [Alphaproteobacteria bacterium]|nr:AAA family ATPase [Alphaproteobacteria bacterium]